MAERVYARYDCAVGEARARLAADGVAVVPALGAAQVERLRAELWGALAGLTGGAFDVGRRESWRAFHGLAPLHGMMLQHWVGHARPLWEIRQDPAVCGAFAELWGVAPEDLLVSFDGLSASLPPEATGLGWGGGALHVDQAPDRGGFECVQGLLNLYPVGPGDATLRVVAGSHAHHAALRPGRRDWRVLAPAELGALRAAGCADVHVEMDAGALALWDSRTVHAAAAPARGRPRESLRLVAYVCMTPRARASAAALRKRIAAFEDGRMTTHWPHRPALFPRAPRYGPRDAPGPCPAPPPLGRLGRRLVGYEA